jgi:hypothetical protein
MHKDSLIEEEQDNHIRQKVSIMFTISILSLISLVVALIGIWNFSTIAAPSGILALISNIIGLVMHYTLKKQFVNKIESFKDEFALSRFILVFVLAIFIAALLAIIVFILVLSKNGFSR